nr:MAG TPA: hypothetical protein [Bacteriophage sp.]
MYPITTPKRKSRSSSFSILLIALIIYIFLTLYPLYFPSNSLYK